jgi:hypothetical protein
VARHIGTQVPNLYKRFIFLWSSAKTTLKDEIVQGRIIDPDCVSSNNFSFYSEIKWMGTPCDNVFANHSMDISPIRLEDIDESP